MRKKHKGLFNKEALTGSKSPRKYWNTVKTGNPQLSSICRQRKLMAKDGKMYLTDVIDNDGVNKLVALIPSKKNLGALLCIIFGFSLERRG